MSRRSLLYRKKLLQVGQEVCNGGPTCKHPGEPGIHHVHQARVLRLPVNTEGALHVITRHDKWPMKGDKLFRLTARFAVQ